MENKYSIIIGGDLVINKEYHTSQIDSQIVNEFLDADYRILNLEAPVTTSSKKIIKTGPHLKSNENSLADILKHLNVNLVTLANNHILDYDENGLIDTLKFCNKIEINKIGAGKNLNEAKELVYIETHVGKICLINISENEWSSATEFTAGANGMDLIKEIETIKLAKQNSDIIILIVHGGHEYYNLPSPRIQKLYRFYIDQGVDAVIAHHTHCISGKEVYKGKNIYYSLGNFLFTKISKKEDWYKGMFLKIEITSNNKINIKEYFTEQSTDRFNLTLIDNRLKFKNYSEIINNETELNKEWNAYIDKQSNMYLNMISFNSIFKFKILQKIFYKLSINISSLIFKKNLTNLLRCESHNDLLKSIIKKNINENSDT